MSVSTYENEVSTAVAPARLFKALTVEGDALIPQILSQAIKSIQVLEGDGGIGTVRKTTFTEGSEYQYMVIKVESLDAENFKYSYSVIEGDVLLNMFEKIQNELDFVANSDGGTILKTKASYHVTGDAEIPHDKISEREQQGLEMFKAIEAYLLANPDVCN